MWKYFAKLIEWLWDLLKEWAWWFLDLVWQMLYSMGDTIFNALPSFDVAGAFTTLYGYYEMVNAWVPLALLVNLLVLYFMWWLNWSLFRIVAKLIWSG